MNTREEMLLDRLVLAYKKQHELYIESRRHFDLWVFLSSASVILLLVILGVYYLFFGKVLFYPRSDDESGIDITLLLMYGLVAYMLIDFRRKIAKASRELDRLKDEIESIGLRIACNQKDEVVPVVEIVDEEKNRSNYVLIPKLQKIDFREYNRLFRL